MEITGAFSPACRQLRGHSRWLLSEQNHRQASNIQAPRTLRMKRPYCSVRSTSQLISGSVLMDSNASIDTFNHKTSSPVSIVTIPYPLPSNIHGSIREWDSIFDFEHLIRDPSATFAPHGIKSYFPLNRPTTTN